MDKASAFMDQNSDQSLGCYQTVNDQWKSIYVKNEPDGFLALL
ncbi:hypothetical protein [Pseudalkalibacillus hwajinpoensis]|nr:hypothetical protein [Pseudalkalibacillus hwajinpoensis]